MAVFSGGTPAFIAAWRAGFWPCPAVRTWPRITSSTSAGSNCARLSAPETAAAPSSCAGIVEKTPLKDPTAVRAAPTIAISVIALLLDNAHRHSPSTLPSLTSSSIIDRAVFGSSSDDVPARLEHRHEDGRSLKFLPKPAGFHAVRSVVQRATQERTDALAERGGRRADHGLPRARPIRARGERREGSKTSWKEPPKSIADT